MSKRASFFLCLGLAALFAAFPVLLIPLIFIQVWLYRKARRARRAVSAVGRGTKGQCVFVPPEAGKVDDLRRRGILNG